MEPLNFVMLALATMYVGYAVTKTEGPFKVFNHVRYFFPMGGLTQCFYCLIFWAGVAFYLLLRSDIPFVVYPFAAAGAATFLYRWSGGGAVG